MSDTPPQVGETCEVTPDSLTRGDTGAYQKSVKLGRTFLDDEVAFLQVVPVDCGSLATCTGHIHLEHLAALAGQVRRQWEVG